MAKRFPIPEFDYEELKGIAWSAPPPLDAAEAQARIDAAAGGDDTAFGACPVAAPDDVLGRLRVTGDHRTAMVCVLPGDGVTVTGRSHAWNLQCVVALEGMPGADAPVVFQWKTPRPMNTRLGPENGIPAPASVLTLISGHRFDDHWIGNRCAVDEAWRPESGSGFRVLWSDSATRNDFHCAVVTFTWGA